MENELQIVEIRKLGIGHAAAVFNLVKSSRKEYFQYFTAFELKPETVETFLKQAKRDQYLGFFLKESLVGFYMLRGLDAGYTTPSYGVFISESYQSIGLARLSVMHALSICRLNQISRLMLKVHPENKKALEIYRSYGFTETGFDPSNGNLVFHKEVR
jgi:ribosomal protein S18 acetylase RimI-like enzyme